MTARLLLRPPVRASLGARSLRRAIPSTLVRLSRTDSIPSQYDLVLNWGNSSALFNPRNVPILNQPAAVGQAINKIECLTLLKRSDINVPPFCTDRSDVDLSSGIYLARLSVTASGGEGIVVLRPTDEVPEAPLYVKYIPKTEEYRVHVWGSRVIHMQKKLRRNQAEQGRDQRLIRNHSNGWVFCNVDTPDEEMEKEAIAAVACLGLDFGAVDVIKGRDDGKYYILEINTAPGLVAPSTLDAYVAAILEEVSGGS